MRFITRTLIDTICIPEIVVRTESGELSNDFCEPVKFYGKLSEDKAIKKLRKLLNLKDNAIIIPHIEYVETKYSCSVEDFVKVATKLD